MRRVVFHIFCNNLVLLGKGANEDDDDAADNDDEHEDEEATVSDKGKKKRGKMSNYTHCNEMY